MSDRAWLEVDGRDPVEWPSDGVAPGYDAGRAFAFLGALALAAALVLLVAVAS